MIDVERMMRRFAFTCLAVACAVAALIALLR